MDVITNFQYPWEGISQKVIGASTMEEALRLAQLDWEVGEYSVYFEDGPEHMAGPAVDDFRLIPTHKAIVREDTGEVLGIVGQDYTVVQNAEAFKVFQPMLDAGEVSLETAGSLSGGRKVWILCRISQSVVYDQDAIDWYALLAKGHDGKLALRFGFTNVRVCCRNTLAMAISQGKETGLIRILHRGDTQGALEGVAQIMDVANHTFEVTLEQYRELVKRGCNVDDLGRYVKKVFHNGQEFSKRGERVFERSILPYYIGEEQDTARKTWWGAYNAVTAFLTHERGRNAETRFNQNMFGVGKNTNQEALKIALQMSA